jgi:membrane protein involved in colicin uptake
MTKSLLATVAAAALIVGAGMASANDNAKRSDTRAGASEMKSQPEMNKAADSKSGAQMKSTETTGSDVKSEKADAKAEKADAKSEKADAKAEKADAKANGDKTKAQTTGQNASDKASSDKSGAAANKATGNTAAEGTPSGAKSSTQTTNSNSAQGTNPSAAQSSAGASQSQSASTNVQNNVTVNLTPEQKSQIRTTVLQSSSAPKVSRSQINFSISVGTVVPRSGVRFVAVPDTLVRIHPAWRGYDYFVVEEEIVIIDPRTLRIVAVLTV